MRSISRILPALAIAGCLCSCGGKVHEDMGKRLEDTGDLKGAIAEYRQSVKDANTSHNHLLLARALIKDGSLDEALNELRAAVQCDVKDADAHIALAEALLQHNELDDAKSEFDVAKVYDPKSVPAIRGAGLVMEKKGDLKGAIEKYREATQADPDYADAHESLGNALGRNGDTEGGRAELDKARDLRAKPKKQ